MKFDRKSGKKPNNCVIDSRIEIEAAKNAYKLSSDPKQLCNILNKASFEINKLFLNKSY